MELMTSTLILLVLTTIAMILQKQFFRKISLNYVALLVGLLATLIPAVNKGISDFQSEIFLGLIVAPLLFFEAQSTRLYSVIRSWKAILSITTGMVIIAYLVGGFGLHYLLGLSLPLCFVMAAIAPPTDATATESVTHGLKVPAKVSYYLENESLFNDASGIVLLEMSTSWLVSQNLKIGHGFGRFVYSALGGILLGLVIGAILVLLRQSAFRGKVNSSKNSYDISTSFMLIYILTPFIMYFLAEELKMSGILAVVAAGLVHRAEAERSQLTNPYLIYNGYQVSRLTSETLNAMVFVILGVVFTRLFGSGLSVNLLVQSALIGLVLYLANLIVRYVYTRFAASKLKHLTRRDSIIFALGGVHGTVTFALAYTLSEEAVSDKTFNLVLLSESFLIIFSMIIPTILFRFILPKDISDLDQVREIERVRKEMVNYAREGIKKIYLPKKIYKQLDYDLRTQDNQTSVKDFLHELKKTSTKPELSPDVQEFRNEVYRYAFRLERDYLGSIAQQELEYRDAFMGLYREVLMAEILFLRSGNQDD